MLSPSKETTTLIVNFICSLLRETKLPDTLLGIFVVCIHIVFGLWMIFGTIFKSVDFNYYIYIITFLLVIVSNYYFHGCILTRIEVELLLLKNWVGPASLIGFLYDILSCEKFTKITANLIIKYFIGFPLATIVIIKTFLANHIITSSILFCILTPLLFLDSQAALFQETLYTKERLDGKIIAITGCSSGIGESLAKKLHSEGATIILLNRNSEKSNELSLAMKNSRFIKCDLSEFESVRSAASQLQTDFPDGIDVLVNNAGVSNISPTVTKDDFDLQIQTNFLSHVLLIDLLTASLTKKKGRIVNHISISYAIPAIQYDGNYFKKNPTISSSLATNQILYQQSKLALLLYSNALTRKLNDIDVVCVHPGICNTDLFDKSTLPIFLKRCISAISYPVDKCSDYLYEAVQTSTINKIYGPNVLFMNFNNPSKYLVNEEVEDIVYSETRNQLGLDL
jgi:NAD(P)-dependent dehydrogenase (short-subunit alcohol dehydrogenase family)